MPLPPIIFIDKPTGMTSFDVIRVLRRRTGVKKFGHAGTLDPAATGLMILGANEGTKQLTEYIKLDKAYEAEILIGESRTTGDMDGEVLETVAGVQVAEDDVRAAMRLMVGTLTLPVSAYSAIKKDGVPMYKRAYAAAKLGEIVRDVPVRDMKVYEAKVLDMYMRQVAGEERIIVRVHFHVGSGTYVRSLGEELGRHLGYPATLYSLRRTQIGKWTLKDAKKLEDF